MGIGGTLLARVALAVGPVAAAGAFALIAPSLAGRLARGIERLLWRAGRNRFSIPMLAALVSILLSIVPVLISRHPPEPFMHDEFSYLLAGDTFAHGRLTNPPLPAPVWQHLETFHVIQRPTYMSKYMPGQGFALALGQLLTGHAIVGVWLSLAFACGAVAWMLLGWVPRRFALIGGCMMAALPSVMEWGQNYWGGAIAMAGGALTLGAFARIVRRPNGRTAIVMGAGVAMMALGRPFEGALFLGVCCVGLIAWFQNTGEPPVPRIYRTSHSTHCAQVAAGIASAVERGQDAGAADLFKIGADEGESTVSAPTMADSRSTYCSRLRLAMRIALPLGLSILCLVAFIGYYNWRVTGSPLRMPYAVHEAQYGATPLFIFQRPKPMPAYRHRVLREYQQGVLARFIHDRAHYGAEAWRRIKAIVSSFIQPRAVIFPLLFLPFGLRRRKWMWVPIVAAVVVVLATFLSSWLFMHYLALMFCVVPLLTVQGMRQMRAWRIGGKNVGRLAVLAVFACCVWPAGRSFAKYASRKDRGLPERRAELLAYLQHLPGKQLVFVHYDYTGGFEWVYNRADVNAAKVVWAREMSPKEDQALIDYFHDRQVWEINGNAAHPRLRRYDPGQRPSASNVARPAPVTVSRASCPCVWGREFQSVPFGGENSINTDSTAIARNEPT